MWSTGNPRHAIRHEIAHAIQNAHKLNDVSWSEKLERIKAIFKLALAEQDGYAPPSEYAGQKLDEFISESVAEYLNNPEKTRSTAKKDIEILQRGEAFYVDVYSGRYMEIRRLPRKRASHYGCRS